MWNFIKNTFSSFLGTLIALFAIGFIGFIFIIGIASMLEPAKPSVQKNSILVLDLSMSINDKPPSVTPDQFISMAISGEEVKSVSLRTLLNAIQYAANDSKIKGIFLTGNLQSINMGSGYAAILEVRDALEDFKETGKPVYAYNVNAMPMDYYLMSVADELNLNPYGQIFFNGLGAEMTFYANAFEKWGIGVQPVRVGKFKSAIEPYIRDNMSEANREQIETMINSLWSSLATKVAESRKLSVEELDAALNSHRSFSAYDAIELGLIDREVYFDEVLDDLKTAAGDDADERTFTQTDIHDYIAANSVNGDAYEDDTVAIIYIEGVIVGGKGEPNQAGGEKIARRLRDVRLDDDVKAVVLRVNSPGGSATASEIIQREIRLLKEEKPVVVSMGYVAASGGYWVSAYADKIYAQENTITGSIGVFGIVFNIQDVANNLGITWDYASTHKFSNSWTITRPQTEEELALLQTSTEKIYDDFLNKVAEGRGMEYDAVQEIAQGRVWTGSDALRIGLVDELGGLKDAIAFAVESAGLSEGDYSIVDYPSGSNIDQMIQALLEGRDLDVKTDPASVLVNKIRKDLDWLKSFNDPSGIYLLPEINFNQL